MTVDDTTLRPRADADHNSRLGPIAGLVFIVSVAISAILFGDLGAEPTATAGEVVAQYNDPEQDIQAAAFVAMLGIGPLLVFLPIQRRRMRSRGATWEADTLVLGFVFVAVAAIIDTGVDLMGEVAAEHGHSVVAQAANDFSWNVSLLYSPGILAVGLAAASAGLRGRGLPAWLGGFAVLVLIGAVMPWIGLFVALAWMLALSVTELVGKADVSG